MGGELSRTPEGSIVNNASSYDCEIRDSLGLRSRMRELFKHHPDGKVRVHIVPTQAFLDKLVIHAGKFDEPEEFHERFYDTPRFELLNNKCWLRERSFVGGRRDPEWVFQAENQNLDDGTHFYQEYRGRQEEIVTKTREHIKLDAKTNDLASLCPIIIGAFLTQRFYLGLGEDYPYLDRCYFDLEDTSEQYRYNVVTCTLCSSSNFQHLPSEWMSAPSKIAEYLRRNWPSRYSLLVGHNEEPLTDRVGEALILERLLPAHPSEEILHDINPRKYEALQDHKRFEEKLIAVKHRLIPALLEEGHSGEYAICDQDEGTNLMLAEDQFEANNIAEEKTLQGSKVFVFPVTQHSLNAGASDGAHA